MKSKQPYGAYMGHINKVVHSILQVLEPIKLQTRIPFLNMTMYILLVTYISLNTEWLDSRIFKPNTGIQFIFRHIFTRPILLEHFEDETVKTFFPLTYYTHYY